MKEVEKKLERGAEIGCANTVFGNCETVIKKGDPYVMRGWYMYCSEACAEEDD